MPDWLDNRGKSMWLHVSYVLERRGQLSIESATSLEALCRCYSDWMDLAEAIRTHGYTYTTVNKRGERKIYARPEVSMHADADRRLRGWLCEFGLTDASRGRVAASAPTPDVDPLAAYLQ